MGTYGIKDKVKQLTEVSSYLLQFPVAAVEARTRDIHTECSKQFK
jgi:hypothetical protein